MGAQAAPAEPLQESLDVAERWVVATLKAGHGIVFQFNGIGGCPGVCNAAMSRTPYGAVVVLSERDGNDGTSVTNVFGRIATRLRSAYLPEILPQDIRWLEHYPAHHEAGIEESLAKVKLHWDEQREAYTAPKWQHVNMHEPTWMEAVRAEPTAANSPRPVRTRSETIAHGIALLRLCLNLQSEKDGVDPVARNDDFATDIAEAITLMTALRDLLPMQDRLTKLGRHMETHGRLRVNYGESYAEAALARLLAESGLSLEG